MAIQTNIDDKIQTLNDQVEQAEQRAKLLKAQAKLAAQLKEQFPNAVYTVQPNGNSGYVDRSINAQTHGAIKRHVYNPTHGRFAYYYELTTKIGREKITLTSEQAGLIGNGEVALILDAASASKGRKRPASVEVEAGTPTVRE